MLALNFPSFAVLSTTPGCLEVKILWCEILYRSPKQVALGLPYVRCHYRFERVFRAAEIARQRSSALSETRLGYNVLALALDNFIGRLAVLVFVAHT